MERLVIITGPSGAGKTLALHSFEDAGYLASDNVPPCLLSGLASFCCQAGFARAAVVVDTRLGTAFNELEFTLTELKHQGIPAELLFLDAADESLVRRFKETRRPHPMLDERTDGDIVSAIHRERALLQTARALADHVIDTSTFLIPQMRDAIHSAYAQDTRPGLLVTITSFGFKHGLPIDADLVFDVRFLANPHYVADLKPLDGRDPRVAAFVRHDPRTAEFQVKMNDLVRFALPQYQKEGKTYLNIAIGCTGGRHRSVMLAEELSAILKADGFRTVVHHRDLPQDGA
jgi:RNase adapter protein RapZ